MVVYDPEDNTFTKNPGVGVGVGERLPPVGESVAVSKRAGVETAHSGTTQAGARVARLVWL